MRIGPVKQNCYPRKPLRWRVTLNPDGASGLMFTHEMGSALEGGVNQTGLSAQAMTEMKLTGCVSLCASVRTPIAISLSETEIQSSWVALTCAWLGLVAAVMARPNSQLHVEMEKKGGWMFEPAQRIGSACFYMGYKRNLLGPFSGVWAFGVEDKREKFGTALLRQSVESNLSSTCRIFGTNKARQLSLPIRNSNTDLTKPRRRRVEFNSITELQIIILLQWPTN